MKDFKHSDIMNKYNPNHWQNHYPDKRTAERMFRQWYARYAGNAYQKAYNCSDDVKKKVIREFGWQDSNRIKLDFDLI